MLVVIIIIIVILLGVGGGAAYYFLKIKPDQEKTEEERLEQERLKQEELDILLSKNESLLSQRNNIKDELTEAKKLPAPRCPDSSTNECISYSGYKSLGEFSSDCNYIRPCDVVFNADDLMNKLVKNPKHKDSEKGYKLYTVDQLKKDGPVKYTRPDNDKLSVNDILLSRSSPGKMIFFAGGGGILDSYDPEGHIEYIDMKVEIFVPGKYQMAIECLALSGSTDSFLYRYDDQTFPNKRDPSKPLLWATYNPIPIIGNQWGIVRTPVYEIKETGIHSFKVAAREELPISRISIVYNG